MMSEIKSTISKDNDVVITEIEIAAPPARVFQALVEREQALQWGSGEDFEIIQWEMDVRPGGKWSFARESATLQERFSTTMVRF